MPSSAGGMAATVFEQAAEFIERSHEAGDWHWPGTLMEDLFYSNELEAMLPAIEDCGGMSLTNRIGSPSGVTSFTGPSVMP